jgi:chromosome segregation ATPase
MSCDDCVRRCCPTCTDAVEKENNKNLSNEIDILLKQKTDLNAQREQLNVNLKNANDELRKVYENIESVKLEFLKVEEEYTKKKIDKVNEFNQAISKLKTETEGANKATIEKLESDRKRTTDAIMNQFLEREKKYKEALAEIKKRLDSLKASEDAKNKAEIKKLEDENKEKYKALEQTYSIRDAQIKKEIDDLNKKNAQDLKNTYDKYATDLDNINKKFAETKVNIEISKKKIDEDNANIQKKLAQDFEVIKKKKEDYDNLYQAIIAELDVKIKNIDDIIKELLVELQGKLDDELGKLKMANEIEQEQIVRNLGTDLTGYVERINRNTNILNTDFEQRKLELKKELDDSIEKHAKELKDKINNLQTSNKMIQEEIFSMNKEYINFGEASTKQLQELEENIKKRIDEFRVEYDKNKKKAEEDFVQQVEQIEKERIESVVKMRLETVKNIDEISAHIKNLKDILKNESEISRVNLAKSIVELDNQKINIIQENADLISKNISEVEDKYKKQIKTNSEILEYVIQESKGIDLVIDEEELLYNKLMTEVNNYQYIVDNPALFYYLIIFLFVTLMSIFGWWIYSKRR